VISLPLRNRACESGQLAAEERGRVGLFTKTRSIVGLDIGSSAVKAVELKPAGKGFRVAAYGSEPVPPDSCSANRKNWRHDSSTDAGFWRYASYASAM